VENVLGTSGVLVMLTSGPAERAAGEDGLACVHGRTREGAAVRTQPRRSPYSCRPQRTTNTSELWRGGCCFDPPVCWALSGLLVAAGAYCPGEPPEMTPALPPSACEQRTVLRMGLSLSLSLSFEGEHDGYGVVVVRVCYHRH
jgi:hypothetical protein